MFWLWVAVLLAIVVAIAFAVPFAVDEDLLGIAVECLHYEWRRFRVTEAMCFIGFLVSLSVWTAAILFNVTLRGAAHLVLIAAVLFLCRAILRGDSQRAAGQLF